MYLIYNYKHFHMNLDKGLIARASLDSYLLVELKFELKLLLPGNILLELLTFMKGLAEL